MTNPTIGDDPSVFSECDWNFDPSDSASIAMLGDECDHDALSERSMAEESDFDIPDESSRPMVDGASVVQIASRLILTNFVPRGAPYSVYKPLVVDREGDIENEHGEKIGTLTNIVTPARFRQYTKMVACKPNDIRLRCLQWMTDVRGIAMDAVVPSFGHSFGFYGEPIVFAGHKNESTLAWSTPSGGVVVCVDNTGSQCGFCLGCKSIETSKYNVPEKCVYFIRSVDGGPIKIGTSINPMDRLNALQTAHPTRLKIIGMMKGGSVVEKALHVMFATDRLRPNGEWFHPSQQMLDFISEVGGASDA